MSSLGIKFILAIFVGYPQAFRFVVSPDQCPMISKYGPSLSKALGPVDPSFLVVKKSHFTKNVHLTASLQNVHVGCQYSKTCLKQPLKKDKTKILKTNGSLMRSKGLQNAPLGAFCNTFDLQ